MPADTLENLAKTFPAGARGELPVNSFTGKPTEIRVLPAGVLGYTTPWSLTHKTVGGKRYYCAEWMDTSNRALFTRRRDAANFLDMHRYAGSHRRITGALPTWATESN